MSVPHIDRLVYKLKGPFSKFSSTEIEMIAADPFHLLSAIPVYLHMQIGTCCVRWRNTPLHLSTYSHLPHSELHFLVYPLKIEAIR